MCAVVAVGLAAVPLEHREARCVDVVGLGRIAPEERGPVARIGLADLGVRQDTEHVGGVVDGKWVVPVEHATHVAIAGPLQTIDGPRRRRRSWCRCWCRSWC